MDKTNQNDFKKTIEKSVEVLASFLFSKILAVAGILTFGSHVRIILGSPVASLRNHSCHPTYILPQHRHANQSPSKKGRKKIPYDTTSERGHEEKGDEPTSLEASVKRMVVCSRVDSFMHQFHDDKDDVASHS